MKSFFPKLFAVGALCGSAGLFAATIEGQNDIQQRDNKALQEWINAKRQVTVKEIGGALSISGEVRFEYQCVNEQMNGFAQRGIGGQIYNKEFPYPTNLFDVEVNLMFDYRTDRTWGMIKIEFDNDASVFNGTLNKVKLERAYLGGRVYDSDTLSVDAELGRRTLGNYLDSKLQYRSFSDGLLFRFVKGFEKAGEFYTHLGAFLIDDRNNHFGYNAEIGMLEIASTGLYVKYSFIDWNARRSLGANLPVNYDFVISQGILGYRFIPKLINKMVAVYTGFLYNHQAKRIPISNFKKSNMGGYAGLTIGQLRKQGDWSWDMNYQLLQAQAVPDFDMSGIGLGNTQDHGFYTVNINGTGGKILTSKDAYGNGNFQGYMMSLDYQLTDTIMLQQMWMQSWTLDKTIGPYRTYKQYEIEFVYAF